MPLSFSAAPITWISVVNGEHFPVLGLALTTNGLQSIYTPIYQNGHFHISLQRVL